MGWSLVDALSEAGSLLNSAADPRRAFYVPVSSVSPGLPNNARTIAVTRERFDVRDDQPIPSDQHALHIDISPPAGPGFSDDGLLPDPCIRLHATGEGFVKFRPGVGSVPDSLELEMLLFQFPQIVVEHASWWERWLEASCIPQTLVYENVDRASVQALLDALPPSPDPATPGAVPVLHGVSLPVEVTAATKPSFSVAFMTGGTDAFLRVRAGAYIGVAAPEERGDTSGPTVARRVTLRVQYQDHTSANPHFMNPRELFYLVFGEDSVEAQQHPLLRRIHQIGDTQNAITPESKRMWLRPPLRTYARVKWEASLEIARHASEWARYINGQQAQGDQELSPDRLYNRVARFFRGPYQGEWKCNLFVFDVCLRSGYRVPVFRLRSPQLLYYCRPSSTLANAVDAVDERVRGHDQYGPEGFVLLAASTNGTPRTWGRRWTRRLVGIASVDGRAQEVNRMIQEEGRVFILNTSNGGTTANPNHVGSGHIRIVESVLTDNNLSPLWMDEDRLGVQQVKVSIYEAVRGGARLKASEWISVSPTRPPEMNNEIFLVELHPGRDPDTVAGLTDLNVE